MKDKKIYMMGICGIGMGSLAGYMREMGAAVYGSDQNIYPPMSELLNDLNIKVNKGYSAGNLMEADRYIIGNAISKTNEEVQALRQRGVTLYSMPGYLEEFILKGKHPLVVAGTHGKTTTTALLSWTLTTAGYDPSVFCGGIIKNWNKSYRVGKGKYFVLEGDEYDSAYFDKVPKFLHYMPRDIILTSIEFDHADIYNSLDEIKQQFEKLIKILPEGANILAYGQDKNIREVLEKTGCRAITYGTNNNDYYSGKIVSANPVAVKFEIYKSQKKYLEIALPMLGRQNVINATGVVGLLDSLSVPPDKIKRGLESFPGVKRRGDILATINGVTVVEDFAHHPTAVSLTLEGFSMSYPESRIWAVFEPRTNTSRRKFFAGELAGSFKAADKVILAKVFNSELLGNEALDAEGVVKEIKNNGKDAYYIPSVEDIVSKLRSEAKSGDIIVIMSNGGFDNIYRKLIRELKKN